MRRRPRHPRWLAGLVGLLFLAAPTVGRGQRTRLDVAGWPRTVTSTSGADFESGAVALGTTTITVNAATNSPTLSPRSTTVRVQCVPACPRSGTLPLLGLQWRRDDQVGWTPLTTAYVAIEQRNVTFNGTDDPWTRTLFWRYVLDWTTNPPTAASQFRVRFQLIVAAP